MDTANQQSVIEIDERALDRIKDIAIKLFQGDTRQANTHRYLYQALADYLEQRGVKPNFVVKI